jgi:hypothetical protein
VIGPKKLSTIRAEIEKAFGATGDDPIRRLEQLIASAKSKGESIDVLQDLKRFLELPRKQKRRKQRVRPGS